jgi:fermentation-respiration switch protein FrsA (DUF1100 family)
MLKGLILVLATSYVAWFIERHETRVVYPFDATYSTPQDAGEPRLTERRLVMPDGAELIVWVAPASAAQPVVLYLPGNAGTLADRAPRFGPFLDQGYGLAVLAYRGSSGSAGAPDEALLTQDALTVAAALPALTGGAGDLMLYGESLGSAVAIKLAGAGVGTALVLESPFTSIPDLVAAQYPAEDVGGLFTQQWDSRSAIRAVRQPLLILQGANDRLVPPDQGAELFEAARTTAKSLHRIPGAGHAPFDAVEAQAIVFAFLAGKRALGGQASPVKSP